MKTFFQYVLDSLRYPRELGDVQIEGTVYLGCIVEIDGRLTHIRVKRGIGGGWNEAAIQFLEKTSGDWESGFKENKAVRTFMIIPIKCLAR